MTTRFRYRTPLTLKDRMAVAKVLESQGLRFARPTRLGHKGEECKLIPVMVEGRVFNVDVLLTEADKVKEIHAASNISKVEKLTLNARLEKLGMKIAEKGEQSRTIMYTLNHIKYVLHVIQFAPTNTGERIYYQGNLPRPDVEEKRREKNQHRPMVLGARKRVAI